MKITYSLNAMARGERLFPVSKHRSKRVLKKLLRRYGGEHHMLPAIFQIDDMIVAHPSYRAEIERGTS